MTRRAILLVAAFTGVAMTAFGADAAETQVQRGKYLVTIMTCADCHTPGAMLGKPDTSRLMGGSDVGFEMPGLGVFHPPNLTPDKETGIGAWTSQQIVTAIRTGARPDGRELIPIMPWHFYASLTDADAYAIAAYLKTLPPVRNKVPGPFGPSEKPTSFVSKVVPPN